MDRFGFLRMDLNNEIPTPSKQHSAKHTPRKRSIENSFDVHSILLFENSGFDKIYVRDQKQMHPVTNATVTKNNLEKGESKTCEAATARQFSVHLGL